MDRVDPMFMFEKADDVIVSILQLCLKICCEPGDLVQA